MRWDIGATASWSGIMNDNGKDIFGSQAFQSWLNVRKFNKLCLKRDTLVVEHKADAPNSWRDADILGAGQIE